MLKKIFKDKRFIFIFAFVLEFIFYYFFEHLPLGGEFLVLDIGLVPILGLMFGPYAALGQAFASLSWQLFEGADPLASLIDCGIMFFISILTYKLWYSTFKKRKINTPKFDSTYNLLKFIVIMAIVSLVYFSWIAISFEAYPGMYVIYPLSNKINMISYVLNMFFFSIIFGLILISIFNIKKIPLQSPKKWFDPLNIKYKYFVIIAIMAMVYVIPVRFLNIDNDLTDHIFFMITLITTILFCLNRFEVDLEIKSSNYSIIEKIILFFMIILFVMSISLFDEFQILSSTLVDNLDTGFLTLITLTYETTLIVLFCIIHVYYIENTITNPIYGLINSINQYKKNIKSDKDNVDSKLNKYLKSNDDISRLIESFVSLKKNIGINLSKIKNATAEKEKIETEFNIAHNIQSGMIETNFDEFSKDKPFEIYGFMNPANEVGGDFYDYFDIDEETIGFNIGDVSGKGVPATLFMVKTMYLIKNHSKFDSNLKEVFENVNNLSCMRNDEDLFVTSWFGKLNLKSGDMRFVNAGHNPPLIRRDKGDFEYLNIPANFVLGGMEDIPYDEHELSLNSGDMIFLYTDGITEANHNYEGFFGENRLIESINKHKDKSLDKIIGNIKNEVYEFCGTKDQFDDMTMLIIKYTGGDSNE